MQVELIRFSPISYCVSVLDLETREIIFEQFFCDLESAMKCKKDWMQDVSH